MSKVLKKRMIVLGLCLIMAITVISGCGAQKSTDNQSTTQAPAGSTAASTTAETPQEEAKLVYWNIPSCLKTSDDTGKYTKDEMAMNIYLKKFRDENPKIQLEIVDQTYENLPNLFKVAGLAQNGPDTTIMWAGSFTNDFKQFVMPLDPYMTADELSKFPDLSLCRADFKTDGQLLALPTEATSLNIFYNKELFKKAGVDENYAPATWAEFIDLCNKLKAANVNPIIVGDKEGWTSAWILCEFLTDLYGPSGIFDFKDSIAKATDENFKKAYLTWADFFRLDLANKDYYSLANDDAGNKFLAGEAAMRIGGSWDTGNITNTLGDKGGTFMIPSISADAPFAGYLCSQFSNNLVVTSYSKYPEAAVKFIKFITSADFQIKRYEQDGQLPARIDADISSDIVNLTAVTSFSWMKNNKNVTGFDSIMNADACQEFYRLSPLVINGKMSVDEAVKHIQDKVDAAMKQ